MWNPVRVCFLGLVGIPGLKYVERLSVSVHVGTITAFLAIVKFHG